MNQIVERLSFGAALNTSAGRSSPIRTDTVYVVYTTPDETLAALHAADRFASGSGVPVTLIHFRTVPYGQSVEAPCGISPVEADAFVDRLAAEALEVQTRVCLCRDERAAIVRAFAGPSLVFIGSRHRRLRHRASRLRRALEAAGHFVVPVDPSDVKESAHA